MEIFKWAGGCAENISDLAKTAAASVASRSKPLRSFLIVQVRRSKNGTVSAVAAIRKYAVTIHSDVGVEVCAFANRLSNGTRNLKRRFFALKHNSILTKLNNYTSNICSGSFFSGSLSRINKMRRTWTAATASLCAALALSVMIVNSSFSLDLYYRGQEVGAAENIAEVEQIVANTEQQLAEILGHEYTIADSLSVSASLRRSSANPGSVEDAILSNVDGVEEKYVLLVEGEVVGASDKEEILSGLLDNLLAEFTSAATASVRFASDVEVVRKFVSEEVVSDPEVIMSLIAPENEESGFSLDVENIESTLISEQIPFDIEYIEDDTLYEDESVLVEKGESGVVLVTETLVTLNGVEQSRERAGEMVAKEPVTEVIAVGTNPRPATASYGTYIWPAQGIVTSTYGPRSTSVGSSNHKGLDIAGKYGQSIFAADGGEVIFAGWNNSFGYLVRILHDNGEETYYAHNSKLLVTAGERVAQGQEIALMGSTGISSGVHCHFEVRVDGVPVDPQKFLS